jgi:hypothetical protein
MLGVLLIDAALCALLIILAAWVIIGRRRRQRDRAPMNAGEGQGPAAELAGDGMAGRETAVVPGFGDDRVGPDPGLSALAKPERAAEPQASRTNGPAPDPGGPGAERYGQRTKADGPGAEPRAKADGLQAEADAPPGERDAPRAEQAAPRADPQANGATGPAHDLDGPATEPDAPQAAPNGQSAGATASDRIGSYYDEADRAMSDYLAARGWTEEPETRRTG